MKMLKEVEEYWTRRAESYSDVVCHELNHSNEKSWMDVILKEIPEDKKIRDISKKERRRMIELMKNFEMHISGVRGFNEAIVTRGGVNVKEINPATMESKKVKGLYFAGEILDVDGICGGYNLQWAWSSGAAAGKCAGRESDK